MRLVRLLIYQAGRQAAVAEQRFGAAPFRRPISTEMTGISDTRGLNYLPCSGGSFKK
jgi:hypothetical protein